MVHEGTADRGAESLFDLWEAQWSAALADPLGVRRFVALWSDAPAGAEAIEKALEPYAGAADVFKLWLVALTGHAMTANLHPFAVDMSEAQTGVKSGTIDGKPAASAASTAQNGRVGAGRSGVGKSEAKRRQAKRPNGAAAKRRAATRAAAAGAPSGDSGHELEHAPRRAAGASRRTVSLAKPARRAGKKAPRRTGAGQSAKRRPKRR